MFLKAMELYPDGTEDWAESAACAFDQLMTPGCNEMPKPEWWNDEALKALSARAVAVAPDGYTSCTMRARVLTGDALTRLLGTLGRAQQRRSRRRPRGTGAAR